MILIPRILFRLLHLHMHLYLSMLFFVVSLTTSVEHKIERHLQEKCRLLFHFVHPFFFWWLFTLARLHSFLVRFDMVFVGFCSLVSVGYNLLRSGLNNHRYNRPVWNMWFPRCNLDWLILGFEVDYSWNRSYSYNGFHYYGKILCCYWSDLVLCCWHILVPSILFDCWICNCRVVRGWNHCY